MNILSVVTSFFPPVIFHWCAALVVACRLAPRGAKLNESCFLLFSLFRIERRRRRQLITSSAREEEVRVNAIAMGLVPKPLWSPIVVT